MKSVLIVVTLVAIAVLSGPSAVAAGAPATSGIYLSAADYSEHRLSFEGDCKSSIHKLELHDVLNKPYIHVTHGTETKRYEKSDLFGFRSCEGLDYRFSGNHEYQILEAKQLYIYVVQAPARLGKDTAKDLNKVSTYYVSAGANGQVVPLTVNNLKQAFPDNHKFHDSLDQMLGTGGELAQFDDFHKMFKVNRLLIALTSTDR